MENEQALFQALQESDRADEKEEYNLWMESEYKKLASRK